MQGLLRMHKGHALEVLIKLISRLAWLLLVLLLFKGACYQRNLSSAASCHTVRMLDPFSLHPLQVHLTLLVVLKPRHVLLRLPKRVLEL